MDMINKIQLRNQKNKRYDKITRKRIHNQRDQSGKENRQPNIKFKESICMEKDRRKTTG